MKKLLDFDNKNIENILDFHRTVVDLEDDLEKPSISLFRNKLIIKLIKKYGYLESLKKVDSLKFILNTLLERPTLSNNSRVDITLVLVALSMLKEKLEELYKITVLEKISTIFKINNNTDYKLSNIITADWFLSENNILDLICAREFTTFKQLYIDGTISPEYEISYSDDEKYQRRIYYRKTQSKEKAYSNIANYINLENIDVSLKEVLIIISHVCSSSKESSYGEDLEYFYNFSCEILRELPEILAKFIMQQQESAQKKSEIEDQINFFNL